MFVRRTQKILENWSPQIQMIPQFCEKTEAFWIMWNLPVSGFGCCILVFLTGGESSTADGFATSVGFKCWGIAAMGCWLFCELFWIATPKDKRVVPCYTCILVFFIHVLLKNKTSTDIWPGVYN